MTNSFLSFLESMTIAMEADDITGQTADDVRNVLGGTPSTQTEDTNAQEEEDLEKVDDIFGTETPNNQNPTDNLDDTPQEEANPDNTEEVPEENPEDGEKDPNVAGDVEQPTEEESEGDPDLVFTKKNRIRDNLAQLYTIISGNIEIISNSLTTINDSSTVDTMNIVLSHLRNCKKYAYTTLTKDLKTLDYDELLQRYITLKRVYDICIEMMEKHFDKDKKK